MKKKISSIINFIRLEDHRVVPPIDHFEPVAEQMKLVKKYGFPATWLLQVDSMLLGPYPEFFKKEMPENNELGVWLEINRAHCDAAGVKFRGRDGINWDHHSQASLTIGYTQADRIKLADTAMSVFFNKFGFYPRSVAAWYIDAFTLNYLAERYHIKATANCRDQWGTDGYSIWGGFWAGAYFPSRRNANLPGSNSAGQIHVPLFRMLASCPVNQYDYVIGDNGQGVCTLEPTCSQSAEFWKWWMPMLYRNMFDNLSTDYSYIQLGQENSFGWPRMKEGYRVQMEELDRLVKDGMTEVMTMGDSGEWFLDTYDITPPLSIAALEDSWKNGRQAFWYNSRFYRASLVMSGASLAMRDFHIFDNRFEETYFDSQCNTHAMVTDAPPVVESFLWHERYGSDFLMRIEVMDTGGWRESEFSCISLPDGADKALIVAGQGKDGSITWDFSESEFKIMFSTKFDWRIHLPSDGKIVIDAKADKITMSHRGLEYGVGLSGIRKATRCGNDIFLEAEPALNVCFHIG